MALIRRSDVTARAREAVVLDMASLRQEAERMLNEARQEADRLVRDAQTQCDAIREQTSRDIEGSVEAASKAGYDQGYQTGYSEGFEKGQHEGSTQGHDQAHQELTTLIKPIATSWGQSLEHWEKIRAKIDADARHSVMKLAVAIAIKIVRRMPDVDPTMVEQQVTEALSYLSRPTTARLHVNPDDISILRDFMPKLLHRFDMLEHADLVPDEHVDRGGCILKCGVGRIDATLHHQLDLLVNTLLHGEDIVEVEEGVENDEMPPSREERQAQEAARREQMIILDETPTAGEQAATLAETPDVVADESSTELSPDPETNEPAPDDKTGETPGRGA